MDSGINKGSKTGYKSVVGSQMPAISQNEEEQFSSVIFEDKLLNLEEFLDHMVINLNDGIINEENVNDVIGDHDETRLHLAAANGRADIYNRLIEIGAGLDAKDIEDETPLHWAARSGKVQACKDLIEAFPEETLKNYLNMENKSGENALFAPAENGDLEVCDLLLKKGIDANAANEEGLTSYGVALENIKSEENLEGLSEEILAQLEDLISNSLLTQQSEILEEVADDD